RKKAAGAPARGKKAKVATEEPAGVVQLPPSPSPEVAKPAATIFRPAPTPAPPAPAAPAPPAPTPAPSIAPAAAAPAAPPRPFPAPPPAPAVVRPAAATPAAPPISRRPAAPPAPPARPAAPPAPPARPAAPTRPAAPPVPARPAAAAAPAPPAAPAAPARPAPAPAAPEPPQEIKRELIKLPESVTVGELAAAMRRKSTEVIKALLELGVMATVNEVLDPTAAKLVADKFHFDVEVRSLEGEVLEEEESDPSQLRPRPP